MVTAAELRARTRIQLARAQLPVLQLQQVPVTDGIARQQQIEQDVARVLEERATEESRIADLRERMRQPGLTSAERNELDNEIREGVRLLVQLDKARANIRAGFTFESAVSRATQTAVFETRRAKQLREFKVREQEVLRKFEQEGLRPIIVRGEIVGFSDEVRQQSIPLESLGFIGKERLQGLERAGLITFKEIPLTQDVDLPDFTPLPTKPGLKEQLGNIFFKGKQLVGIGIPGVPLPFISSEDINKELEKRGLVTSTIAGFIPETPAEVALTASVLGGLASLTGVSLKIASGVLIGLGTGIAVDPELETEERLAGAIIAIAPFVPFLAKKGFQIRGKKGESAFTQGAFDELGKFFKKEKGKKSDLQKAFDDFSEQLKFRREANILRDTTQAEKLELMRKSFDNILKTKDSKLRKQQTEGFVKLLKVELGETQANSLMKEFLSQEGVFFKQQGATGRSVLASIKTETARSFIIPPPAKVDLLSRTKFNQERVEFAKKPLKERFEIAQKDILKRKELTKDITKQQKKISTLTRQKASQKTLQRERQKLRLLLLQRQNIGQLGRQVVVQRQLFEQQLIFRQKQILAQRLISRQKLKKLLRPGRPRLRPRLFPRLPKVPKKKKVKKIPKEITGFKVFVRKKGKDISIGTFAKKKKARKELKKRLATTLRASGFITDPTGKKLKPKVTKGFRISKVDPFRIVEKRRRRLDTGSEVRAIQEAKLKAMPVIKFKRQ